MNKVLLYITGGVIIIGFLIWMFVFRGNTTKIFKSTKELELTYEMSAGIPFKRVYEIEDESVVQFVRSYIAKDENTGGKVGAPVYTTYVFKGLKEGQTKIIFKVVSIDDRDDTMSEVINIVKVDQEGNISLVEGESE